MANPDTYKKDNYLLDAAGISGLVYAVLSAIDACVRPRSAKVRIFDEFNIGAA